MNRICKILGIKYPVVQAPMTWITSAEMVAAVCNAGGMGTLGTNAGQSTVCTEPDVVYERMCEEIRKTRALTDKPFALNYMLPVPGMEDDPSANMFSEAILKSAVDEKVPVIVAVGAYSERELKRLKELGKTVIFREETPSADNAKRAEALGVDIIVATGFDEGGGVPGREIGTISIVPIIADAVNIPVMAAGGIVDNRGFKAALALDAEGVFCGTVFIASEESFASQTAKQDIVDSESFDLVFYRALPYYWRATPHALAKNLKVDSDKATSLPEMYRLMGGTSSLRISQLEGNLDEGINSTNTAISLIKAIRPCKDIIDDMVKGCEF